MALNLLEKLAYCLKKRHLWILLNALVKSAQHIPCHLLIGGAELLCYCALCAIEFLHGLLQKLLPNAAVPFLKGNSYFHVCNCVFMQLISFQILYRGSSTMVQTNVVDKKRFFRHYFTPFCGVVALYLRCGSLNFHRIAQIDSSSDSSSTYVVVGTSIKCIV